MYNAKLIISCLFLLLAAGKAVYGQAIVSGKISGYKAGTVSINYQPYALLEGLQKQEVAIDAEGHFSCQIDSKGPMRAFILLDSYPVEEAITLAKGDGRDTTMQVKTNRAAIIYLYLNAKDNQQVEANWKNIPATLTIRGKNSANSRYLNEEDWRFNSYKDKHLKNYFAYVHFDEAQYTAYVEQRQQERQQFLADFAKKHSLAKQLKAVSNWTIYGDAIMAKLLYPSMRSSYRKEDYKPTNGYFDFLPGVKLDQQYSDKGIAYYYFADYYLKFAYKQEGSKSDYFDFVATKVYGKARYAYGAFALGSNFKQALYNKLTVENPYSDIRKLVKAKYATLEGMLEGKPAPAVALENAQGQQLTLADFKGKYVYIDFWATWCGPCIAEIPALELLQHDYATHNIHFLSISVDQEKDKAKWLNFIQDKQLKGNQLWISSAENKKVSQAWNILQIPRFVLLDPEGKIVDANAPRPSDAKIRTLFDALK